MSGLIWILVPLVFIIGGYIIDYQKNKLKWQSKNNQIDTNLEELKDLISTITGRIENLEAIAANDPSEFSEQVINIPEEADIKGENQKTVEELAKTRRTKL